MGEWFETVFVGGMLLAIFLFIVGLYFLPTLIALAMHHHHTLPIFLLNLFAGWTGAGWLGALIWSVIV